MRVLINGVVYDSTETPIVTEFDVNEQELFNGMKKFVSAPVDYTEEQRNELMSIPLEKLEKEHHRKLLHNEMKVKTNKSEEDFYNWIEKALRDNASYEEIVKHIIETNMTVPYSFVSTYNKYKLKTYPKLDIIDHGKEIDYWKQLFYNEYEARERAIDDLHRRRIKELFEMAETIDDIRKSYDKSKEVLEQIESWTKNPKIYEPSMYTINHMCRDALGMNEEKRISVNNLTSGSPQVFPDDKKNQLYKYFFDGSIDDIKWKELKELENE